MGTVIVISVCNDSMPAQLMLQGTVCVHVHVYMAGQTLWVLCM